MEITFNSPKDLIVVPQQNKTIEQITISSIQDFPKRKLVQAITKEIGIIVLWEGTSYDTIGQWTDTDVENRIKEIYA